MIAPIGPIITDAAAGTVSPSCTCSGVSATLSATAVSPIVVASVNGIENQHIHQVGNLLQLNLAVQRLLVANMPGPTNTVPKLPTILMTPKIKPPAEAIGKISAPLRYLVHWSECWFKNWS